MNKDRERVAKQILGDLRWLNRHAPELSDEVLEMETVVRKHAGMRQRRGKAAVRVRSPRQVVHHTADRAA